MGDFASFLDYIGQQNDLSGLQKWAQDQAAAGKLDQSYADLAQNAPRQFQSMLPKLYEKQQEGSAIAQFYGGNQPEPPKPLESGIPLDADSALKQLADQNDYQQSQQKRDSALKRLSSMAYLPTALQSSAAQQMMFQGAGFGGTNDQGAPVAANAHGDDYLSSLSPSIASQVKGLAEGKIPFPSSFALKSPYWQQMISAVSQYDPEFDAVNYQSRASMRKDATSGKMGTNINALNTVAEHVATLKDAADALHNGDYQTVNKVANWFGKQTGDDAKTNFDNVVGHVAEELTKAYRGAGGAESDIKRELENLNSDLSPKQFEGAFKNIGSLLSGKIDALQDQYKRGMGTAAKDVNFYSPKAAQAFQKFGVDVAAGNADQTVPDQASQEQAKIYVNPQTGQRITKQNGKWVQVK